MVHSSLSDKMESLKQEEESHDQIGYRVFGDINTVYSEIALNMICKDIT